MRKILDGTKTVDEALALAQKYIPFDLDKNSPNAHFQVVDASGRSVILEYDGD
jgi:penicillin V acylase-like amidase (Ntn superfamily)